MFTPEPTMTCRTSFIMYNNNIIVNLSSSDLTGSHKHCLLKACSFPIHLLTHCISVYVFGFV